MDSACYFPLGAYIDDMLKSICKNKEEPFLNVVNPRKVGTVPKESRPALYGKGDAIFVENEDDVSHDEFIRNANDRLMTEPLTADKKVTIGLLYEDITPNNLLKQFGSNYIEDDISVRKFIIKTDLNSNPSSVCKENEECHLLFEVTDSSSSAVEADISVLVPNEDVTPNLVEIVLTDLISFSHDGPLTVKAIVDHVKEKITSEVVLLPGSICLKKAALISITKVPVEFIHNICGKKPKVFRIRDAVQFSMKSNDAKENHLAPNRCVNDNDCGQLCCDICFIEKNAELRTGKIAIDYKKVVLNYALSLSTDH